MKNLIIALLIVVSNPSLAVMIGSESRTKINSPTDKDAKRVGLLEMWDNNFGDNRSYCTASNISKRHIVTAAHCVINLKTGKKYDHIIYYPRHVDILTRSPSRIFIRKAFVLDKFLKEAELKNGKGLADNMTFSAIQNDIAVLEAFSDYEQKYVGTLYGWFGTKPAPPNTQYIGAPISLKSYPGDKKIGTLWSENCKLRSDFSGFAITTCDTFKGASGSAIVWNSPDHKFGQVVGVYSADDEKTKRNAANQLMSQLGFRTQTKLGLLTSILIYKKTKDQFPPHLQRIESITTMLEQLMTQYTGLMTMVFEDTHLGNRALSTKSKYPLKTTL